MPLKPITEEQLEQTQQRKQLRLDEPEPPPENVQALLELGVEVEVVVGGRKYIAPPTPFKLGFRLDQLFHEVQDFRTYDRPWLLTGPYEDRVQEIKSIVWNLLVPVDRVERFLKAIGLGRKPPAEWSDADIGRLLGFFRMFRMKSNIQFSYRIPGTAENQKVLT